MKDFPPQSGCKDICMVKKLLRWPGLNLATSVHRALAAPLGLLRRNTQNNEHTDTMTVGATNRTEHEEKGQQIKRKRAEGGREGREDRAAGSAPET